MEQVTTEYHFWGSAEKDDWHEWRVKFVTKIIHKQRALPCVALLTRRRAKYGMLVMRVLA